jgi:hypothetical protein
MATRFPAIRSIARLSQQITERGCHVMARRKFPMFAVTMALPANGMGATIHTRFWQHRGARDPRR